MAVVYFFEMSGFRGMFGAFVAVYDGHEPIGVVSAGHYIRYECPPGERLFYSLSDENKFFVEANLLAGKVYIIEVDIRPGRLSYIPSWGPSTDRANMKPVNPTQKLFDIDPYRRRLNTKRSKSFYRSLERTNKSFLKSAEKNKSVKYQRRLNKYDKKKEKEKVEVLYPDWFIESETILLEPIGNEINKTSHEATY